MSHRRITTEQEAILVASFRATERLTLADIESWARGEKLPQPKAQHAQRACETLGIEAVWL